MMQRFFAVLLMGVLALSFASAATKVSPRDPNYAKVVAALTPAVRKYSAGPVRLEKPNMLRAGDWIFVRSGLRMVNSNSVGDGQAYGLLRMKRGRWAVVECTVGSDGLDEEAADWARKHHTPSGLIGGRP